MSYRNSVPFNSFIQPDATPYSSLLDDLRSRLKSLDRFKHWKTIHDQHLLLVLQNLHLAHQMSPDTYVAYSRNKNDYSKPTGKAAPFKVSYGATIRIVDGLYDLHLLEGVPGIHYNNENDPKNPLLSFMARMRAKPELTAAFPGMEAVSLQQATRERELIQLRDPEGKDLAFAENEETQRMRENIRKIESVNRRHFIALCVLDEEFEKVCRRMNGDRYGGRSSSDMFFGATSMYRIFCNGTFDEGGRFYGGWWENLPKEYRKFIRIDNRTVEELDYSCLHPTLLYLEERLPVPEGDMYEVPGLPPEARAFLKKSMNIILNAKSETSAIRAIRSEQRKDTDYPPLPEGVGLKQVLEGFERKHSAISHLFYTVAGRRLQRTDSDIAEAVMLHLADKGVPVLPLHDSFIVSRIHKDELEATMNDIISKRYGKKINIKADETSWDFIYEIGEEEEYYHNINIYEKEAINNRRFTIYNGQYRRFLENQE